MIDVANNGNMECMEEIRFQLKESDFKKGETGFDRGNQISRNEKQIWAVAL